MIVVSPDYDEIHECDTLCYDWLADGVTTPHVMDRRDIFKAQELMKVLR